MAKLRTERTGCELRNVSTDDTYPAEDGFYRRCVRCDGPLRLSHRVASIMTGHGDDGIGQPGPFLHDLKSRWYWHDDAGYLSTELLTVLSLSIIPVTLVLVWVAKVAGMVAAV